jgi:L-cysteine/cystine lyase
LELRARFPVLEQVAYLNAGTCGPLPAAARGALEQVYALGETDGRRMPYFERMLALHARQRDAYAAILGARPDDVALTTSTSEGVVRVLAGLDLRRGDEVLTSDAEHPGLLGPLLAATERHGVVVRTAPLAELPGAVGPRTRLVACSHVGWVRGDLAPAFDLPADVPLLLDGAQGAGAIPVDVRALGCAFYAASGQKWLCGPVGTGMLYVAPEWSGRLAAVGPTYLSFTDVHGPFEGWELHAGARRHDTPALAGELSAAALAAYELLHAAGWDAVHARARELAAQLADRLAAAGRVVAPRGPTTLVAWEDADPPATAARLAAAGIAIRDLPGTPYLRASVGAWNDESDLERLVAAL